MQCIDIYFIIKLIVILILTVFIFVDEGASIYDPGYLGHENPSTEKELDFQLHVCWIFGFSPNINYGEGSDTMQCLDYQVDQ